MRIQWQTFLCVMVTVESLLGWASPALALEAPPTPGVHALAGPRSVGGTLKRDKEVRETVLEFPGLQSWLQPYFDFKARMKQDQGLAFGFDYNTLAQGATASVDDDTAAGGVARFYGRWTLLGRDADDTGTLVYKVENRHRSGTDVAPQSLGSELGYGGLTAVGFSDIDWALTNLFWEQKLGEGRAGIVAGVVDTTDYVATYGLASPWTDFCNLAFLTDPTIPAPNQGLGAAASILLADHFYVLGGLADANGDPTDPGNGFDSFLDRHEYFSHLEFGWIPSLERKFTDNVHLTAWHADTRTEAQVPGGWGLAFSYNQLLGQTWEPFVRAGYADGGGALYDRSLSIGLGYHVPQRSDLIGLGLNWGRPSEDVFGPGLDDQYTAEFFYRLHLLPNITITPDVQLLIDPALNPDEEVIAVFGIRARLSL